MSDQTNVKCRQIIEAIVKDCQGTAREEPLIGFEPDWGGNSLTVVIAGLGHGHVGDPDGTFESLVDGLHHMLCGDEELSLEQLTA